MVGGIEVWHTFVGVCENEKLLLRLEVSLSTEESIAYIVGLQSIPIKRD